MDATADRNLNSGDEPGKIRGQERHDIRDVIRDTKVTQRCATRRHQSARDG